MFDGLMDEGCGLLWAFVLKGFTHGQSCNLNVTA